MDPYSGLVYLPELKERSHFNFVIKGAARNEQSDIMEDIGYILSEVPFLALIIGVTIKLVSWRRARANRPIFGDHDRQTLFQTAPYGPEQWKFYPRFLLAVTSVMTLGSLQFVALAPLGAAALTATLVLTTAVIVRGVILAN